MKSFKKFNESAASMMSGSDTKRQKKIDKKGSTPTGAKKAIQGVIDYLAPPASRSNEPNVRNRQWTQQNRGFGDSGPSRDNKGQTYDKRGIPAPAKLDKGTRGTTMPSNPQFKGVGARTKSKTDTKPQYSADDAAKDQEKAKLKAQQEREKKAKPPGGDKNPPGGGSNPPAAPKAKPQKPSAKDDPRNAQYNKMRADLNATTFQSKKDKDGATKATEKIGMNAWRKANPKLAAAKDKRDATRGTSKSTNPLMQKYLKDREGRRERMDAISKQAKSDTIAQSPNADKINKKETAIKDNIKSSMKNQALRDRAKAKAGLDPSKPTPKDQLPKGAQQARTGVPKADTPKAPEAKTPEAKTPAPKAPETKKPANSVSLGKPGDGFTGPTATIGGKTYGIPSGSAPKTTQPAAPAAAPKFSGNVDLKNKTGSANFGGNTIDLKFSKGGEKKKYKKESVKSFSDFIEEQKKTKITINPTKDKLLEGGYSKGGEICSKCDGEGCNHCNNTGKHSKVNKEDYAYVSQEEVSEEGYQEGYETETDLTEALPGSTNPNYYNSKKDFKSSFNSNPGAFKSPLGMSNQQMSNIMTKPENRGVGTTPKPMPVFQQKMMYNNPITQKLMGGNNKQGFYKAAMKANNVQIGKPPTAGGANNPAGGPKPNPMQANRPGFDGKGAAQKLRNAMNKKPLNASRQLMPFGKFRNLEEGREEDAKKSLDAVKKRQGVLDDYEKKTGKKLDITKTPEHKSHKQNFPGAKRTGKKKRGEKESELETHTRRVNKYSERLRKYGKTKKQKEYDDAMAKHTSRFD